MSTLADHKTKFELALLLEDLLFYRDLANVANGEGMSIMMFGLFPYISLFTNESYKYLSERIPDFAQVAKREHDEIIRSSRTMVKLFDEHLRDMEAIFYSIDWMNRFHNEWFMSDHQGLLAWLKKAIQPDLGLYYYDANLISTTHLAFFNVGLNDKTINALGPNLKTALSTISRSLGVGFGEYVQLLCTIFGIDTNGVKGKFFNGKELITKLSYNDQKAERFYPKIFNENGSIALNFSLLSFLAAINFVNMPLRELLTSKSPTFLKLKYITLYHLIASLKRLQNYFYPKGILTEKSKGYFKEILKDKDIKKILSRDDFRNTLVHYTINDANYSRLSMESKTYGLVEINFGNLSADNLEEIIDKQLDRVSKILNEWQYPSQRPNHGVQLTPLARP